LLESFYKNNCIEVGCDEAGRGCLAGPVVAAAVILPAGYLSDRLNDSKKLSEKTRYELRSEIESVALSFAVAFVSNDEIDQMNILKASILAMHRAIDKLEIVPENIIVDGNRFFPYKNIPHTCVVKGDGKYLSIAAASILAKTYRDDYMNEAAKTYGKYNWEHNKGYPTKDHREAIRTAGVTELHRKTFRLLDEQLSLNFI
jgi:ribonuclease HII